jgi:hypothetical protein
MHGQDLPAEVEMLAALHSQFSEIGSAKKYIESATRWLFDAQSAQLVTAQLVSAP